LVRIIFIFVEFFNTIMFVLNIILYLVSNCSKIHCYTDVYLISVIWPIIFIYLYNLYKFFVKIKFCLGSKIIFISIYFKI
jgi:hypothetical protein